MTTTFIPQLVNGRLTPAGVAALGLDLLPRTEYVDPTAIPAHAGTRTHTWGTPAYNAEAQSLTVLRELIAQGRTGQRTTEVLFIGDSKTEGAGLTGAQNGVVGDWAYPSQFRRMLAAREGFIVANVTAGDARWTVSNMTRSDATRNCVVPSTPGSTGTTKSAQLTAGPHTGGTVWVQATAGATITLTVDSTTTTVTLPTQTGWQAVPTATLADGSHTVKVASTSDFDVLGMTLTHPAPGLRVTRAGRSSSTAAQWLPGAVDGHWYSVVDSPATTPDIIICGLGTNAPDDTTSLTGMYTDLAGLNIPVIIVSPGALGNFSPISTYAAAITALYDASDAHDFPLIDFESVVGQWAAANGHGLTGDTLHENARGYALEARAMHRLIT